MDLKLLDPILIKNVQIALKQGDDEGAIECILAAYPESTRDEAVDAVEYCELHKEFSWTLGHIELKDK